MKTIEKIILGINMVSPWILGFVGIFVCAFCIPSRLFDYIERLELLELSSLRPIMNIISLNNQSLYNGTLYPLFGKYKGFRGGHKYQYCHLNFPGSCEDDIIRGKKRTCSGEYKDIPMGDCINNINIPETNYSYYKGKYLYSIKTNKTLNYQNLLKIAIPENENCGENQKKCGYLNKGLILCFNKDEQCPINDIIINNKSEYFENEINYTTIEINEKEYIHFTNQKVDNQIILDLSISIEHPLSRIEITEDDYYDNGYKLNDKELNMYYNGDINNIKTYKKIYNTGMTYKDFLEVNNMYEKLQNEISPRFLSSNVFIYKRYPIPVGLTFKDSNYYNSRYYTAYVLNYVSCGFFFASFAGEVVILITDHKIIGYIVKKIFEFGICLFFFLTVGFLGKINVFGDDSELFKENNFHIIQLEIFHIFYFCFAIIKNLGTLFLLYNEYKSNKTYKENKSNEPEGDTKTTELVNDYKTTTKSSDFENND